MAYQFFIILKKTGMTHALYITSVFSDGLLFAFYSIYRGRHN